jgi:LAO/AO transport system kinase
MSLVEQALAGDRRALAQLISLVEEDQQGADHMIGLLSPPRAHVVGITGLPGAGKSTLVGAFIHRYRALGRRVGVVAVDPSSPLTGGAILGDRIRMQEHSSDPGVFIRSMANRGHLGGLAARTAQVVSVVDAAGYDPVLVETVGVGQAEVEVARLAATVVVVVVPGWGDEIQAAKAGLLEVAHILVVNKADKGAADRTVAMLEQMIGMGAHGDWTPPVLTTVATTGEGVDALLEVVEGHRALKESLR